MQTGMHIQVEHLHLHVLICSEIWWQARLVLAAFSFSAASSLSFSCRIHRINGGNASPSTEIPTAVSSIYKQNRLLQYQVERNMNLRYLTMHCTYKCLSTQATKLLHSTWWCWFPVAVWQRHIPYPLHIRWFKIIVKQAIYHNSHVFPISI